MGDGTGSWCSPGGRTSRLQGPRVPDRAGRAEAGHRCHPGGPGGGDRREDASGRQAAAACGRLHHRRGPAAPRPPARSPRSGCRADFMVPCGGDGAGGAAGHRVRQAGPRRPARTWSLPPKAGPRPAWPRRSSAPPSPTSSASKQSGPTITSSHLAATPCWRSSWPAASAPSSAPRYQCGSFDTPTPAGLAHHVDNKKPARPLAARRMSEES